MAVGSSIGIDFVTKEPVAISAEDRLRGTYVIGKTGTGKTTLLEALILQDIDAGDGVCVLDPHADLIERILAQLPSSRRDDIVLLDPRDTEFPFGLNPYFCKNPRDALEVTRVASQVLELFEKLWGVEGSQGTSWGPRVGQFIRNTALTVIECQDMTMTDIPQLLTNQDFRKRFVSRIRNPSVQVFWQSFDSLRSPQQQLDRAESTLNKLDEFLSNEVLANIVGQLRSTIDFRELMDNRMIVLIPLPIGKLQEEPVSLLGSLVIQQILNAALSREDALPSERVLFNLYVDEFQRFATPSFATLFTEARKYGIATTVAHQVRHQLDGKARAAVLNAANIIVFGVHGEDGEEMAKQFDRTPPPAHLERRQAKLLPPPDPFHELLERGHSDKTANFLITRRLSIIEDQINRVEEGGALEIRHLCVQIMYPDHGCYSFTSQRLREVLHLLNIYLRSMIAGEAQPGSPRHQRLLTDLLIEMRSMSGVAPADIPVERVKRRNRFGEKEVEVEYHNEPLPVESRIAYENAIALAVLDDAGFWDAINEFRAVRERYWQNVIRDAGQDRYDFWESEASSRAEYESENAKKEIAAFFYLGRKLAEEPIYITSAEWDHLEDHPRTYADVEAEIANTLANQPPFRAIAKTIVNGVPQMFDLEMAPVRKVESDRNDIIDAIRETSRRKYARPREQVVNEMIARLTLTDEAHRVRRGEKIEP